MNPALEQLRDIHLPAATYWWPPALGWWLLLGLLLIGALVLWRGLKAYRRRRPLHEARRHLVEIRRHHGQQPHQLAQACSVLLKRVSLTWCGREGAALSGEAWIAFLNRQVKSAPFEGESAWALREGPYRPDIHYDTLALVRAIQRWLEGLR